MKIFDNHRIVETKVTYSGPLSARIHRTRVLITLSNGRMLQINLDEDIDTLDLATEAKIVQSIVTAPREETERKRRLSKPKAQPTVALETAP